MSSSRLRIGIVSEFAYPFHKGGAERRYYELASRLAAAGHDVHWYAMRNWAGGRSIEFEGIRLHAASNALDVFASSGRRSIPAGLRTGLALTKALVGTERFDVLDCSLYPFFHVFGLRLTRFRTPMVVTWYEFWGDYWNEYLGRFGFAGKWIEAFSARLPHRILSVSELAAAGLRASGVPARRIEVVPLGVDTIRIGSVGMSAERSDVVAFGRLKNHKNIDLLLRALACLRSTRPKLTCAIIGDGPERAALERLASMLGLEDNVRFYGELDDESELYALVKASKLFVNPSTKEGGGSLTLLEAKACGLPVVAIRHHLGIDSSLIDPGRTGWWVDSARPEALAATISNALDAVAGSERSFAARCVSFARRYDWDAMTARCERIYREVARSE